MNTETDFDKDKNEIPSSKSDTLLNSVATPLADFQLLLRRRSRSGTSVSKLSIFVTRKICEEALSILRQRFNIIVWPSTSDAIPREQLLKQIRGKDGLLCMLTDSIDKQLLDQADSLRCVAVMAAGYDNLDLDELFMRGIRVGYTPHVVSNSAAELTIALLLATARRLHEAAGRARAGVWGSDALCGHSLKNATVGIVGMGRVGFEVGRRLHAFNVRQLLYCNRSIKKVAERDLKAKKVDFDRLLALSDFVVCCLALAPETRRMFSADAFRKMKKNALFINTSRGEVVDQDDLVMALKERVIWGAGLDVTTPEPLPVDHELFKLDNCLVLPHIGSATVQGQTEMAIMSANNVLCGLLGKNMPAELFAKKDDLNNQYQ